MPAAIRDAIGNLADMPLRRRFPNGRLRTTAPVPFYRNRAVHRSHAVIARGHISRGHDYVFHMLAREYNVHAILFVDRSR